jgi:pSer/pThr/pTyr-binding forkhead associated (FHA) protein
MLIGSSTDNDLHLPSRYVSRHHAAILQMEHGHYYIVDLNSANGVLVNGKSVSSSPLLNNDVLSLGPFRINVELIEPQREDITANLATSDTDVMPAPGFVAPLRVIKR